jgi:hypothetical protein
MVLSEALQIKSPTNKLIVGWAQFFNCRATVEAAVNVAKNNGSFHCVGYKNCFVICDGSF